MQKETKDKDYSLIGEMTELQIDNPARNYFLTKAMDYILENYTEKLTLRTVAEATDISPWYLSRLINQYTGQSFTDILNNIRINKSKEMLCDPAMAIKEIAEAVGFASAAHFSRIFKLYAGVSASQYRKSRKQTSKSVTNQ